MTEPCCRTNGGTTNPADCARQRHNRPPRGRDFDLAAFLVRNIDGHRGGGRRLSRDDLWAALSEAESTGDHAAYRQLARRLRGGGRRAGTT